MADIRQMDRARVCVRCSGSVGNFREKLYGYLKLPEWHWWKNRNDAVIFFGLYHPRDYIRFLWHRGPKKIFWCGSDIQIFKFNLKPKWQKRIARAKAKHYCENEVEQITLEAVGIQAEVRPMLFDDPDKYPISFKPNEHPRVYLTYHPGREQEYGIDKIFAISQKLIEQKAEVYIGFFDGSIPEKMFNQEIQEYQAAIRLNRFDGFSEILAKSALMGQYPISSIKYPHIAFANFSDEWMEQLTALKDKKEPNIVASEYWRKTLKDNKNEVIDNWSW